MVMEVRECSKGSQLEAVKMSLEYSFAHRRWSTPGAPGVVTDGC